MTPADYAEALEGAADLLDEWVVVRDHGDHDAGKAAAACRALAKALRNIAPFCEGGEVWLMSRGWDEVKLP